MKRPDYIPADIWEDAIERAGGEFAYAEVVKCVAIAILEERERCASVVLLWNDQKDENLNSYLSQRISEAILAP